MSLCKLIYIFRNILVQITSKLSVGVWVGICGVVVDVNEAGLQAGSKLQSHDVVGINVVLNDIGAASLNCQLPRPAEVVCLLIELKRCDFFHQDEHDIRP